MSHPLQHKIDLLRRRLRWLTLLYGASWIIAVGLGAIMVLGFLDYLIRVQDPGVRLIFSLLCLAALAWTAYRRLYLPLRDPRSDVELARRIQRAYPDSTESLASAIEFLKQPDDDPLAGSPALRHAVILDATVQAEPLDFTRLARSGPAVHAAIWMAMLYLVAAIFLALDPCGSRIALKRLMYPLGSATWPQDFHLAPSPPIQPPAVETAPDRAPTVSIDLPEATIFATPQATVPLRVAANDDLAIRRIALVARWSVPTQSTPKQQEFVLFERDGRGQSHFCDVLPQKSGQSPPEGHPSGETRTVEYRWNLGPLRLAPGTQLDFHATATDDFPQTVASATRRLVVITPAELANRLAACQDAIRAQLDRALAMVRQSRASVAQIQIRWGQSTSLDPLTIDQLGTADLNQREAARALTSPTDGVPKQILELLAELDNNRLQSPELRQRMEDLLAQLDQLGRDPLPTIASELTAAIKEAQTAPPQQAAPRGAAALATALHHQDRLIARLEQLLAQLTRWNEYRLSSSELGQLLHRQEQLLRETGQVARRTLTKQLEDLPPQDLADLHALEQSQAALAASLDRALGGLRRIAQRVQPTDPSAANAASRTVARADQLGATARMLAASQDLARNRVGQAMAGQKQAAADLRALFALLAVHPTPPLGPEAGPAPPESTEPSNQIPSAPGSAATKPGQKPSGTASSGAPQPADMAQIRQTLQKLWGELPPRQREQLLQSPVEHFLPEYQQMIENYFQRISEEKQTP